MKFGNLYSNLLRITRTQFHLDSFRCDIFIAGCLGNYFFPDTVWTRCAKNVST